MNLPGSVAESTEDDYVDTVRLHLVPALGRKRLAKFTVADLDKLWQAKRDTGYSSNSVKRVKDRDASSGRRTRLVISELKTPKSRRTLTLTPELVVRFRQHRARQAEAQMAAGRLWQDHGLIFASEVGTPMTRTTSRTPSPGCASGPGSATGTRTSYGTRAPR